MLWPIKSVDDLQVEAGDMEQLLEVIREQMGEFDRGAMGKGNVELLDTCMSLTRIAIDKVARVNEQLDLHYHTIAGTTPPRARTRLPVDCGENGEGDR